MSNDLTELTDTELDAVTGGILNGFGNIISQVNTGLNIAAPTTVNLGGLFSLGSSSAATTGGITQALAQMNNANFSF